MFNFSFQFFFIYWSWLVIQLRYYWLLENDIRKQWYAFHLLTYPKWLYNKTSFWEFHTIKKYWSSKTITRSLTTSQLKHPKGCLRKLKVYVDGHSWPLIHYTKFYQQLPPTTKKNTTFRGKYLFPLKEQCIFFFKKIFCDIAVLSLIFV